MVFSERSWRFPFIRACIALLIVVSVFIHTYLLFGLSVDLLFVGFVFTGVWALVVSYSSLAFPKLWKPNPIKASDFSSVVSPETVNKHKNIISVHESRCLVRVSLALYLLFVLIKSVFIDNNKEPAFYFGIFCAAYVLDLLYNYWKKDEKTMWSEFLNEEYGKEDDD